MLEDQIAVLEVRLQEEESKKEAKRLYCTIDGVVTQVKSAGSRTMRGSAVATIVSRSQSEYYADTANFECLPVGTQAEIVISGIGYAAEVTGWEPVPERVGQREQKDTSDQRRVFLTITDDHADEIDTERQGLLTLLVDSRENVLLLPEDAVVYAGEQAMVYRVEAGSGLMEVQDVTVGLAAGGSIEIISGLSEGDQVIIN